MKKLNILFLFLLSFTTLIAQKKGLVVNYSQEIKFDLKKAGENATVVSSDGDSKLQNKMLQQIIMQASKQIQLFQLVTTSKSAIYTKVEKIDNTQKENGVSISFGGGYSPEYLDLDNNLYYQEKENFNEKFEVKDSLTHYDWQLTREKKKVLGFDCRKATAKDGKKEIIAWYAPKLPYKSGPRDITGLPGLILEVTIIRNNKQKSMFHLWATDVQVKDDIEIEFPTFKNPITEKDFEMKRKEMFDRMKEMRDEGVETD